jgi:hypothetical protein
MLNTLNVWPFYRETWGSFDPMALAQLASLAYDPCYQPKLYKAPDDDQEIIPNGGYLKYGLEITPGSLIWGIYHVPPAGFSEPGFVYKVTDMSLGIELWDTPTPDLFVSNNQASPFPWLFSSPYPVVGNGLFNVEFWNNSGGALRCNLVFGVAEVNQCKY